MRSRRMVRASGCQCQIRNCPWVRSQHPPTQRNLEGRQMKQCWITYIKKKNSKNPFKKIVFVMWQHTLQHRKCSSSILSADPEDEDVLVTNLTLLYLSKVNSDPGWFKKNCLYFIIVGKKEKLHCCSLIFWLCHGKSSKRPYVKNGLDKSENKAVNLAE